MEKFIDRFKVLASAVGIVFAVFFFMENRYASARDISRLESQILELRRKQIDDRIFDLEAKKSATANNKLSPAEEAQLQRYQREYQNTTKEIEDLKRR